MKIAVVGKNSSLANYLIPELSIKNEIIVFGRDNFDLRDDINSINIPNEIDVLIHIAAAFSEKTDKELIETVEINSIGTLKICIAAKKAKVKHLIIISSLSAVLNKNSPYYTIYSISKKHSEDLAVYYCNINNIPLTILRPSQIYDSASYFRKHQPLIYLIMDRAEKGEDIEIYGNNDALRNYIYVDDFLQIIIKTIEKKVYGIFSCTYTSDIRIGEIAKIAQMNFKKGGRISFLREKENIVDNVFQKNNELYEIIDYYPRFDLSDGIKKILEYRKKENK